MIAPNTITVISPERSIVMGPFGENHIRSVLPVPDALLQYQPAVLVPYVKDPDPHVFMQGEAAVPGALTWGIFDPGIHPQLTPEAFLGAISLYDDGDTQEIATSIFRLGYEGKGIGTLAKLGVVHLAFKYGIASITSESSVSNHPAHRSLQKAGFTQVGVGNTPYLLANDTTECMTQWLLHSEAALKAAPESPSKTPLASGRKTYVDAISTLKIHH